MDTGNGALVLDRFAGQVARRGHATAVRQGDRRVSYAELDALADGLAARLRTNAAIPGAVVISHLDRSVELVAALLGTLKAGAAYLPVPPDVPAARLRDHLKETGAAAVITRDPDRFADAPVQVVVADGTTAAAGPVAVTGSGIAYVVYTSGSTGAPKGVRISHASLAALCAGAGERYRIDHTDRVLQFAAVSFDTSIEQILVTLVNGAELVLPDHPWAPGELADRLIEHGVTVMDLTPPYWRAFLAALDRAPAELPVRLTVVGGSAVHAADCRTAFRLMPRSRLVNAYGLTETTITSTTCELTPELLAGRRYAPVGTPLPGVTVRLHDDEVHIGGSGLAAGHVVEPAQNRFVTIGGERLYRTGDLGRWTPEAGLEILGRADRQLKIRGFRVEPAEVEACLATHPAVGDVAVTGLDDSRLAAHYTATAPVEAAELDAMPLTAHGKIDLAALPAPVAAPRTAAPAGSGEAGRIEQAVAALWRQVLHAGDVHPDDNFFERGGSSVLAAELIAKVRTTLGVHISQVRPLIRLLVQDASLRSFAEAVQAARSGALTGVAAGRDELLADAELPVPIERAGTDTHWRRPRHVLLTGATGFLGIYLLRELLDTTDAVVHCLVRAADPHAAADRLRANARRYFGDVPFDLTRVRALPGDLAAPGLGLDDATFDRLAATVDVIHHPGGAVNFIYPYAHLKPANVDGTRELVRLAARHRNIPIHYVSTMAVVAGYGTAGVREVTEQTPLGHVDRLSVGYVESKWVAEALLQNAARAGLPVAIHRAADISGDGVRGAWNTATEMCAMKKFVVDTGMAPIADLPMDYTPVDRYAAAVAHIAATRLPAGDVFHLTNPGKANIGLLTERLRARGHRIAEVPWDVWVDKIVEFAVERPEHPMTPFAPLFIDRCAGAAISVAEMYLEDTFPRFGQDNVTAALDGSGITVPPVDAAMIDRYLGYLESVGFLDGAAR